jgi:hypothetical protein
MATALVAYTIGYEGWELDDFVARRSHRRFTLQEGRDLR